MNSEPEFNDLLSIYQRKYPLKVLYLEDDVASAERVRDLFEDDPIDFSIAPSPEVADQSIAEVPPDLVITDHRLADQPVTGEAWLRQNFERLAGSRKILLTGFATEIVDRSGLTDREVAIISKGDPEEDQLWDEQLRRYSREKAARIIRNAAEGVIVGEAGGVSPDAVEVMLALTGPIHRLFQKWVAGFRDPDHPTLVFGTRAFSMNELVQEVQRGSVVGATILQMFIEDLDDLL